MADRGKESSDNGGGWWGSIISAAKQQTEKMCEMVSSDLAEFTSTMQSDTKKVVEKTKETLQQNIDSGENKNASDMMKQSFHSLMSGITRALTVDPEDTSPKPNVTHPTTNIFDRAKARLRAIQVDTGTYLQEPSGSEERYADWLKSFDLDGHKGDISELLVTMVEVRSLYTSLVPSEVSHQDFWQRYFYKVHQLQVDEARKQALMKRAERADTHEDSIGWDEEDEWSVDENDGSPGKKTSSPDTVKREDPSGRLGTVSDSQTASNNTTDSKTNVEPVITDSVEAISVELDNEETSDQVKHSIGPKETVKQIDDAVQSGDTYDDESQGKNNSDGAVLAEKDKENNKKAESVENNSQDISPEKIVTDSTTDAEKEENVDNVGDIQTELVTDVACDSKDITEDKTLEKELTTKLKGDMVVVGDRVSPSTDSSGTKESEDWEQDFDVDITADDLAAASQLAQKMNMSASEYNQLTGGEEDDWENWD